MFVEKYKRALSVLSRKPMMLWGLSLLAVVLGFVAKGKDIPDAQNNVYSNIDKVSFEKSFYRHDIGGKR